MDRGDAYATYVKPQLMARLRAVSHVHPGSARITLASGSVRARSIGGNPLVEHVADHGLDVGLRQRERSHEAETFDGVGRKQGPRRIGRRNPRAHRRTRRILGFGGLCIVAGDHEHGWGLAGWRGQRVAGRTHRVEDFLAAVGGR